MCDISFIFRNMDQILGKRKHGETMERISVKR